MNHVIALMLQNVSAEFPFGINGIYERNQMNMFKFKT